MSNILLTGGTGFIGKRLLPKLAQKNEVFLLVRRGSLAKARDLLTQKRLKNVKIFPGDLEREKLGFSEKDRVEILKNVDYVYHLAASYDLSLSRKKIFEINLGGTKNLATLFKNTTKLKALVYISTAYVAGTEEGVFLEDKFVRPQFFRNVYEEAKFECESLLRKINLPIVIIRPVVVVGDSETGEFDKEVKSGFYQLIRTIDKGLIFFYPGKCDGFISAVPVNWAAEMIFTIGQKKSALGKTFHLADSHPLTAKEFIDQVCGILSRGRPLFQMPNIFLKVIPPVQIKNQILMLNRRQIFDMTNTLAFLGEKETAPSLRSYLGILVNYYRRNIR